jgi:hypothetical protein
MMGLMDASTSPSPLPQTIELPRGHTLVVRHSRPDDAPALDELYSGLSLDDRYRRFFSGGTPRGFAERWSRLDERGGVGVVAVVHDEGGERVVGEAGFGVLPDGDGEFAITVAHAWRGWLGAYLLDVLVREAAARGVPNLRAEILIDNGPMLALVHARGYAVVDHDDWSSVRVTIGTAASTPDWPSLDERPRVLVETPGGRWSPTDDAKARGMQVIACPGPAKQPHACPALEGRPCPLAAHADVIVFAFPPSDPSTQRVLREHQRLHAGVPIVVASASPDDSVPAPSDATCVAACTPAAELVDIVSDLATRHARGRRAPG